MSVLLPSVIGQLKPEPIKGEGLPLKGLKNKGFNESDDSRLLSPFALLLSEKEAPAELVTSEGLGEELDTNKFEASLDALLTLLTKEELVETPLKQLDVETELDHDSLEENTHVQLTPEAQEQLTDFLVTLNLLPEQAALKTGELSKETLPLVETLSTQLHKVKSLIALEQKKTEVPLNSKEQQQLNQLTELKEEVVDLLKALKGSVEIEPSTISTVQQQQSKAERPDTLALQASFALSSRPTLSSEKNSTGELTKAVAEPEQQLGTAETMDFASEQSLLNAETSANEEAYSPLLQTENDDTAELETAEFEPAVLNREVNSGSSSEPVQPGATDLASLIASREIKPTPDLRAPASAKTPLAQTQWAMEQAQDKATFEGQNTVRLKLNPDNLGPLTITMSKAGPEGLNARILAATPEALQQLEHELDTLRQNLNEQGLTLKQVTINLAPNPLETSASNPHSGQQQQAFQQATTGFSFQQNQQGFQQAKQQANANATTPLTQGYSGDTTQGSGLENNDTLQAMTPWEARNSRLILRA